MNIGNGEGGERKGWEIDGKRRRGRRGLEDWEEDCKGRGEEEEERKKRRREEEEIDQMIGR